MEWVSSVPSTKTNISLEHSVRTTALYQPDFSELSRRRPTESDFQLDPITSHSINLLKYIQKLNSFSEQLDLKGQQYEILGNSEHLLPLVNTVIDQPPESNAPQSKSSLFSCPPLQSVSRPTANDRIFLNCQTLDPRSKMRLLQRSVLISCLFEGLDDCDRHILDTLTDLLDNFFSTISTQMAHANLASLATPESQTPYTDLANLQKILVGSGVGTVPDVLDFQKMNFVDRNRKLMRLSEAAYKDCISKQEKLKKELVPQTQEMTDSPSSFPQRNISEPFSSSADFNVNNSRRDGSSLKRSGDPIGPSSEEDILGFYGHAEYVGSNPAKKAKDVSRYYKAKHLVFLHRRPLNSTNQYTDLEETFSNRQSPAIPGALQTPPEDPSLQDFMGQRKHKAPLTLCTWCEITTL